MYIPSNDTLYTHNKPSLTAHSSACRILFLSMQLPSTWYRLLHIYGLVQSEVAGSRTRPFKNFFIKINTYWITWLGNSAFIKNGKSQTVTVRRTHPQRLIKHNFLNVSFSNQFQPPHELKFWLSLPYQEYLEANFYSCAVYGVPIPSNLTGKIRKGRVFSALRNQDSFDQCKDLIHAHQIR